MIHKKILSLLVLLMTAATGAWADQLATSYSSDATLSNVTVSADMDITIASGVTVTINNGLTITSGTLTVYGPGTLMVYGTDGGDGQSGGTAISGNIIIKGGANVQANGGRGGAGSTGQTGSRGGEGGKGGIGGQGGNGGNGGAAFTGAVTIYSGSINAFAGRGGNGGRGGEGGEGGYGPGEPEYTGPGGNGGDGGAGGNGGSGGAAFAGTLTFFGGSVTAVGGSAGDGGTGGDGGEGGEGTWNGSPGNGSMNEGEPGSNGNAFASAPTIQATTYTMTNGDHVDITTATGIKSVILSAADAYDTNDPNDMPPVEVTTNAAEAGATFTEATFTMPDYDATVAFEMVRDMAVSMTTKVGDGDDGAEYRIRVKKNEQGDGYVPAEMDVQQVIALFKVHDGIENKDLTFYGAEAVCALSIYAADDNDQPTGNAISFANLEPGRYVAVATAADGSAYDGSTAASNVLVLFEGYPVEVAAKEYITYYKDENLKLDTEETDAKIYTITDVNGAEATATQLAIAPMNVPILVYNSSDATKTVLLIPTDDQADDVTAYLGFVGTLEATTIAASTNSQNNYAMNGKEFIWVRTAIPVAANKAWLEVPMSSGNNANIRIVFDNDETTEIEGVDSEQLTVDSDDSWYDLQGRKLDGQPTTKGVYIWKGKKVAVK